MIFALNITLLASLAMNVYISGKICMNYRKFDTLKTTTSGQTEKLMAPNKQEPESESEVSLRIGIVLFGELVKKFEALKQRYGIRSNSDLMRFLVSQQFEQLSSPVAPTSLTR